MDEKKFMCVIGDIDASALVIGSTGNKNRQQQVVAKKLRLIG
jgi:hypothetical protein